MVTLELTSTTHYSINIYWISFFEYLVLEIISLIFARIDIIIIILLCSHVLVSFYLKSVDNLVLPLHLYSLVIN